MTNLIEKYKDLVLSERRNCRDCRNRIMREYYASGMTAAAWCRENKVPKTTFYRWRQELNSEEDPAGVPPLPRSAAVVGAKETGGDPPAFRRGDDSSKTTAEVRVSVEMPLYSAAGPVQVESADVPEEKAEPVVRAKVVLQGGRWQVHIYDGCREDTLSSVLRVVSQVCIKRPSWCSLTAARGAA